MGASQNTMLRNSLPPPIPQAQILPGYNICMYFLVFFVAHIKTEKKTGSFCSGRGEYVWESNSSGHLQYNGPSHYRKKECSQCDGEKQVETIPSELKALRKELANLNGSYAVYEYRVRRARGMVATDALVLKSIRTKISTVEDQINLRV
jgi:hypothetical protein